MKSFSKTQSKAQSKAIDLMLHRHGEIISFGGKDAHPDPLNINQFTRKQFTRKQWAIVPRGDRRCRPVGWLGHDDLQTLLSAGVIEKNKIGYGLAASYRKRALAGGEKGTVKTFSAQHRQSQTRQLYHPDGIASPTQSTRGGTSTDRLLNLRDKAGHRFFQTHEIEAAARFMQDYARSRMGAVVTQNYDGGANARGTRANTAEDISNQALDARTRVMAALDAVGPGLDQSLKLLHETDTTMGALETNQQWARGSGKTVLKLALGRLSNFYGCEVGDGTS